MAGGADNSNEIDNFCFKISKVMPFWPGAGSSKKKQTESANAPKQSLPGHVFSDVMTDGRSFLNDSR